MGKIHIPPEWKIVFAIVSVMLVTQAMCPGTMDAQELPKKLVSAQTDVWRSDFYVYSPPSSDAPPARFHAGDGGCVTPEVTIGPGQVSVVRDFTLTMPLLCRLPFQLVTPPSAPSYTVALFDNGANRFSFKVPPIGAVSLTHPVSVFPVVNDGVDRAIPTFFPSEPTTVYYRLGDGPEESCNAKPPVSQCPVLYQGSGVLSVYLKKAPPCGPLCVDPQPVYGLVTNGRLNGAALTAYPF